MAQYRMRATGEVLDEDAYKALHPNVSFAPNFVPVDADRIVATVPPIVGVGQRAVLDGIVFDGGKWMQAWRVEDLPPEQVQAIKRAAVNARWADIKAERTRRERGGAKVGSHWFQTDADSRIKFLGIKDKARDALLAGGDASTVLRQGATPIRWKTYDNSFATVTVGLIHDLVEAIGTLDQTAFACAETHRVAMIQSPDPSVYDFSDGWPAIYGEAAWQG